MLPEEIKQQRLFLNLTQAELAAKLGVSALTVSRWERGEVSPDAPPMLQLALHQLAFTMSGSERHQQFVKEMDEMLERQRRAIKAHREFRQRVRKSVS
jgi:transcriptional regulator with XRE-family HTH domain